MKQRQPDVIAFEWTREDTYKKQGLSLARQWKETFLGLTETEVREKLMQDMRVYDVRSIAVYRSVNNWCKKICINGGNMCLLFDKHTRRVTRVY